MRARLLADGILAAAVFVVMEPVTYLVHRHVMHGPGLCLHRSHHRSATRQARSDDRAARSGGSGGAGLEANDLFPVMFAGLALGVFRLGYTVAWARRCAPVAVGVSAYGCAYLFVHDVYIHRRLGSPPKVAVLERLRSAHGTHHRYGGEPYGMLWPSRSLGRSPR